MNKLDLDISKYSSGELCEIFNVNSNLNSQQIIEHMNTFKGTIITDNSMTLGEKDGVSKFIDSVAEKLADSLDKTIFLRDITQTFSAPQNTLVENSYNHPIIENPNLQAGLNAKIYEGSNVNKHEYPPGYINPINIKTTKRQINIDSRFRSAYYNSISSNFHYDLPDTFKKVVNMRITSFNIPLSIYGINSSNNCFTIDSSNVDISSGNYSTPFTTRNTSQNDTSGGIVDNLNNVLASQYLQDISYNIDLVSGKSILTAGASGPYTVYFNKDCSGTDDLTTPLPLKFGWLLGYRAGIYTIPANESIISEGIISIEAPRYLYLCVNDYTAAGGNNFIALYNESTISPHIMGRIPYQELNQRRGRYNYGQDDDTFEATREYFGPVDIQKLNIQILDEYGRVVDFNNMDWSCTITFEVLYD